MKRRTEHVDQTLDRILKGEDVAALLNSLTAIERELLEQLVSQIRNGDAGVVSELNDLWKIDYVRRPPTVREFVHDDYWLGSVLNPNETSQGIFPEWDKVLEADFDLDSRVHNVVITGSLGIGKCFGKGTEIMMFDGSYKTVETVKDGDLVMGDDSTKRRVTGCVTGNGKLYKVTPLRPKHGPGFVCNGPHILCLTDPQGHVHEISVEDYLKNPNPRLKLYRVPISFKSSQVKIDPYWLGLWIGDGSSHEPSLTISEDDPEISSYHRKYAASLGLTVNVRVDTRGNKAAVFTATNSRGKPNPLLNDLRAYGLAIKGTCNKFIPEAYLKNSTDIRRKVLAGLIDSDGGKYCHGCYGIATIYEKLSDQIVELSRGLGYQAVAKKRRVSIKRTGYVGTAWFVCISGAYELPTRVKRKKSGKRAPKKRSTFKTGFTIEPVGFGTYYGFELDGNRRFVIKGHYVTHNTYISVALFLYRLAVASLLRNPQHFFGLGKGSSILYSVLSVTRRAVLETAFGDALNFMANSPFFIDEMKFNPDRKYADSRIPMGKGIYLTSGSKGQHVIGRNAMGVFLDEGNWRLEANPDERAYALYDEIRTRISNRFQKTAGFLPAISILASSARDESSFTEKVIGDIEKSKDSNQKIYRYSVYKIRRPFLKLKDRWFKVAYGLKSADPFVLSGWYNEKGEPVGDGPHEPEPAGAKIEFVPEDYHDAFLRNCTANLQSLSGISSGGNHRLFPSTVDIERCIELATTEGLENPAKIELIPISNEDNKNVWDYLNHRKFLTRRASQVQPIRHPDQFRFAHVDLATTSMAGVSVCHLIGNRLVENLVEPGTGRVFSEHRLIVEYDFILTIVAGRQKPISLEKIQNFFFWLRDVCNYKFGLVTYDQWQSDTSLQMMESRGFNVDKLSLDRHKTVYYSWRTGFEELRLRLFRQYQLMRESEQLLDGPDKVDHPQNGSKDTTDSAAGAYFNAITQAAERTSTTQSSTPGVFGDRSLSAREDGERPPIEIVTPPPVRKPATFYA